jgi:minor histocompatibility antigen H13
MASDTATTKSGSINYMIYASYMTIIGVWGVSQLTLIPYVIHLLVLVTAILYVACHTSLVLREVPTPNADGSAAPSNNNNETLRQEDAYQFPLLGSVSLFSLYLAFKFLDKDLVNLLIGLYFGTVGCLALYATLSSNIPPKGHVFAIQKSISHSLPSFLMDSPIVIDISMAASEILLFLASVAFCASYFYLSKPWAMNNVLGICFCLQGIERFSLGTYKIGAILLVGLFFYDIFWV